MTNQNTLQKLDLSESEARQESCDNVRILATFLQRKLGSKCPKLPTISLDLFDSTNEKALLQILTLLLGVIKPTLRPVLKDCSPLDWNKDHKARRELKAKILEILQQLEHNQQLPLGCARASLLSIAKGPAVHKLVWCVSNLALVQHLKLLHLSDDSRVPINQDQHQPKASWLECHLSREQYKELLQHEVQQHQRNKFELQRDSRLLQNYLKELEFEDEICTKTESTLNNKLRLLLSNHSSIDFKTQESITKRWKMINETVSSESFMSVSSSLKDASEPLVFHSTCSSEGNDDSASNLESLCNDVKQKLQSILESTNPATVSVAAAQNPPNLGALNEACEVLKQSTGILERVAD